MSGGVDGLGTRGRAGRRLGARYAGGSGPGSLDDGPSTVVDRVPAGRRARRVFSVGDPARATALNGGLAAAGLLLGRPRLALVAAAGPVLTGVATTALKPLVGRRFGRHGEHAFPSGHTGPATALATAGTLLAVDVVRPPRPWGVVAVAAGTVAVGAGTGPALTAIDVHDPTDTVGGAGTAVAVVLATARLLDALAERGAGAVNPIRHGESADAARGWRSGCDRRRACVVVVPTARTRVSRRSRDR